MNGDLHAAYRLLLNLLIREYAVGDYLSTIPQYDSELASFMRENACQQVMRFHGSKHAAEWYFPICYYSKTSMHLFSNIAGQRSGAGRTVQRRNFAEAVADLAMDMLPELSESILQQHLPHLITQYELLVKNKINNAIPRVNNIANALVSSPVPIQDNSVQPLPFPSAAFISEHGDGQSFSLLVDSIHYYALVSQKKITDAALAWTKQYSTLLFTGLLDQFLVKDLLYGTSVYSATLHMDEHCFPRALRLHEDTQGVTAESLSPIKKEEILHCMLDQLLTHHVYPLFRALGIVGFLSEDLLMDSLSERLCRYEALFGADLDFLQAVYIRSARYLPRLFQLNTAYAMQYRRIPNLLFNRSYYAQALLKPLYNPVLPLGNLQNEDLKFELRALDLKRDLPMLHSWINEDCANPFGGMDSSIANLEAVYMKYATDDYRQCFIGTLDGESVFAIELYWALQDEIGKYHMFERGDYGFHMLIAPAKKQIPPFSLSALTLVMDYFFSFQQVARLISDASVTQAETHKLILKIGGKLTRILVLPYKTAILTVLTREALRGATGSIHESRIDNNSVHLQ